jgi:hypothetical protein
MSRIFKNTAALALMVGALIASAGTSDAQNYRYNNNAYGWGPAYNGAQRSYYNDSFNNQPKCWVSPASINYVPCF